MIRPESFPPMLPVENPQGSQAWQRPHKSPAANERRYPSMTYALNQRLQFAFWLAPILLASFGTSRAQTAAFTYQGNLIYDGVIANGSYDLQFRLYDQLTGGSLQGSPDTVTVSNLSVISAVFTAELNSGASASDSSVRFLEISVRPAGSGSFTTLWQRQQITSPPYAIRSLTVGAASTAANFTGSLAGDVAGAQSATVIQLSAVTAG